MTKRHAHAGERAIVDAGIAGLPLLAPVAKKERQAELRRIQERMEPRIIALALAAGAEGIIASEVIARAIADWGIWTGQEWRDNPRAYSMVGPFLAVLARRGLLSQKRVHGFHVSRKSERDHSHHNEGKVYLHPAHVLERREEGVA